MRVIYSIVRKDEDLELQQVLNILQMKECTLNKMQQVNSTQPTAISQVHYVSYEKNKKSRKKPPSIKQNTNSKSSCFRSGELYSKEHKPVCRAQNAICNGCDKKGHFQIVWKTSGRLPERQQKPQEPDSTDRKQAHYISDIPVQTPTGFYNEQGNCIAKPPSHSPTIKPVYSLSVVQTSPVI